MSNLLFVDGNWLRIIVAKMSIAPIARRNGRLSFVSEMTIFKWGWCDPNN